MDSFTDANHGPGTFGEIVHKEVIALLWILIKIEDLWYSGNIFLGTFPPEVGVYSESTYDVVVLASRLYLVWHHSDYRYAITSFTYRTLGTAEGSVTGIWIAGLI